MSSTRTPFVRGPLPPGIAGARLVGVLKLADDGTIADANDTFLGIAGMTRDELASRSADQIIGSVQSEPWQVEFPHADGRVVTALVELVDDDTAFVVDVSATRIAEHALTRAREVLEERSRQLFGEREGAIAAAADLETQRRQVEELAAQLANANRELDAFSYSVSHDLRAPLRSIDGFSRVLLSNYGAQLDDRGRDYLQRVRSATQRMSHLLDDLLKLARTSRAAINETSVDLTNGAQQIAAELQQLDPQRRVTWAIQPGLTVRGDRTLLRVVLDNLLRNAWKFTSKREQAVIELGREGSVFHVRDNGAGYDSRYADQLFGVFQRLHTADEFEGTGIGLATVQRILHRHGGEIWSEGTVDGGATFYFTIGEKRPHS